MSPLEYISEALPWWDEYVALLVLFLVLHWPLIRRWAVGFYDPLFMLLLSNVFGWSIVWFMGLRGDVAPQHVAYFSAAQILFYLGFWVRHPGRFAATPAQAVDPDLVAPKATLSMAMTVNVLATLAIWGIAGIPLFRESRLGAFQGSGGFGILERLADASSLIVVFCIVTLLIRDRSLKRNLLVHAAIGWSLLAIALSGSKGALLSVGQFVLSIVYVYTALRHRKDRFWAGRAGKLLLVAAFVFGIAVVATQQEEGDLASAALGFVYRIVSYGDVYIFAYPDATIERLQGDNAWIGLFGGFLSTFRLFPQDWVYPNIGFQFTGIVFPSLDLFVGPNPQHPVFGYHFFGGFGVLFSFVLGLVTAQVQRSFFHRWHSTFLGGLVTYLLYFDLVTISIDFEYALSKVASSIIGLVVILLPVLLFRPQTPFVRRRAPASWAPPASWT